jgi:hypothetical protein
MPLYLSPSRPEILTVVAATGATETIDVGTGGVFDLTLDANVTLTFTSPPTGSAWSFTLILRQDGAGARTVTWPGSVDWPGSSAPTLSTGANDVHVLVFLTVDGGTTWLGFASGLDMG